MSGQSGSQLSEYELLRLRNIKRNHEFMKSLGLPVPAVPAGLPSRPRKTPAKKRNTLSVQSEDGESSNESSDDSDEDWVPGSEEVRKQKKMIKRFIPDFRPKPQTVPVLKDGQEPSKVVENEENDLSAFDELGRLGEHMDFIPEENVVNTGKQRRQIKSVKGNLPEKRYQYATRGKNHSYCEPEVPDDDHYIFCEECQDLHYGDCPVHGPLQIIDDRTDKESSNLSPAVASLPAVLKISKSSIPEAGLGVFSTTEILKGVRFGPYKGKNMGWEHITDETNTSYMWEIVKDGKFRHFVDGQDENHSNWMRFVNCSRCEDEQNVVAYQFRGEIYYRTYKSICPGKELLVWYGESYAKDLGISLCDSNDGSKRKGNAYTCENCQRMYTSVNFLQRHRKYCSSRTIKTAWKCEKCCAIFKSVTNLNSHIRQFHANGKQYQCTQCGKTFDQSIDLTKHFRAQCGRASSKSSHLTTHLRTHTGEKTNRCTQCNKAFNQSSSLATHLRTHTGEKPYQCTQCNKAFNQSSALTKHLRTHTGEKPYQCTQCNKAFNQSSSLATHLRTHTGEKPYQCTQCNKAFNRVCNLKTHLRTHTGEKPYHCTQCNKAFYNSSHLTTHLRTHTGEKPYQCTQCNKAFSDPSALTRHLRTHTGEKPYQCTQCNKAFNNSSHLTMHFRTHTGEKPYQCTQCNKAFKQSGDLTRHLRTHTGGRSFESLLC